MKYQADLNRAISSKKQNKQLLDKYRREKPKDLDQKFHQAHEEVFEEIDCLDCANCCKTTSPIFLMSDIERMAKSLKLAPGIFIEKYLYLDADKDYVLKSSPCPFLLNDNTCLVYEDRPKACKEYPHTNRKKMHQITQLTWKNSMICPAVTRILEKLRVIT
ncbi:MAG: YkgJ family cysteine cluster protein [Cyclobacteriaceae bacterium]